MFRIQCTRNKVYYTLPSIGTPKNLFSNTVLLLARPVTKGALKDSKLKEGDRHTEKEATNDITTSLIINKASNHKRNTCSDEGVRPSVGEGVAPVYSSVSVSIPSKDMITPPVTLLRPRRRRTSLAANNNMTSLFLSEYHQAFSKIASQSSNTPSQSTSFRLAMVEDVVAVVGKPNIVIKPDDRHVSHRGQLQSYTILRKVYDCYLNLLSESNKRDKSGDLRKRKCPDTTTTTSTTSSDSIELSFMVGLVRLLSAIDLDEAGLINDDISTCIYNDGDVGKWIQKVKGGRHTLVTKGKHPSSKKRNNNNNSAGDKYRHISGSHMTPADLYAALLVNTRTVERIHAGIGHNNAVSVPDEKCNKLVIDDSHTLKILRLILSGWVCDTVLSGCSMYLPNELEHHDSRNNTSINKKEDFSQSTGEAAKRIAESVKIIGSISADPLTGFSTEERDNAIKTFVDAFTQGTAHLSTGSDSKKNFSGELSNTNNVSKGKAKKLHNASAISNQEDKDKKFFAIVASKTVLESFANYILPNDERAYLLSVSAVLNGSGIKDMSGDTDTGETHSKSIERMQYLLGRLLNNGIPPEYLLKSPSASTMKPVRLIEYIRAITLFCSTNASQIFRTGLSGDSERHNENNGNTQEVIDGSVSSTSSLPTGNLVKSQHMLFPKLGVEALSNISLHLAVKRIIGFTRMTIHHLTPISDLQRKSLIAELILHGHCDEAAAVASTHLQMLSYVIRERRNTLNELPLSTYFIEAGDTLIFIHQYICDRFDEVKKSFQSKMHPSLFPTTNGPVYGLPATVIAALESAQQQSRDGLSTVLSLYANFINELSTKLYLRANDSGTSVSARVQMQEVYDKFESIVADVLGLGVAAQISQMCADNICPTMIAALQASSPSLKDYDTNDKMDDMIETRMHLWVSKKIQSLGASVRRSIYGSTLVTRYPVPVLLPTSSLSADVEVQSPLSFQTSTKKFLQDMLVDGVIRPYVAYLAERVARVTLSSDDGEQKRVNHEDGFFTNSNVSSNRRQQFTTNKYVNTTAAMQKFNQSSLFLTREDMHEISRVIYVTPLQRLLEETGPQQNIMNERQRVLTLVLDAVVGLLTSFHKLVPTLDSGGERLELTNFKGILRYAYIHQKVIEQRLISNSCGSSKISKTATKKQPKFDVDTTLHDMILLADVTYIFPPSVQDDALLPSLGYSLYEQVVTGKLKEGLFCLKYLLEQEDQHREIDTTTMLSPSQSSILLHKIEEVFLNSVSWLGRTTADQNGLCPSSDSSLDYCFQTYLRVTLPFITFDTTSTNDNTIIPNKSNNNHNGLQRGKRSAVGIDEGELLKSQRRRAIMALSFLSQLRQSTPDTMAGDASKRYHNRWLDTVTTTILQHCGQGSWSKENKCKTDSQANIHEISNAEMVLLLEAACGPYSKTESHFLTFSKIKIESGQVITREKGSIPGAVQAMTVRIAKEMILRCTVYRDPAVNAIRGIDAGNVVGSVPSTSQMCTVLKFLALVVRDAIIEYVAKQLSAHSSATEDTGAKKANILVELLEHVANVVVDRRQSLDASEVAIAMDTIAQHLHGPFVTNGVSTNLSYVHGVSSSNERLMMSLLLPHNTKLRGMQEKYIRSFVFTVMHCRSSLMPNDIVKCLKALVTARVHHATCFGAIFQRVSDTKGLFNLSNTISIIEIGRLATRLAAVDSREPTRSMTTDVNVDDDDDIYDYSGGSLTNQRALSNSNSSTTRMSTMHSTGRKYSVPSAISSSASFNDGYGLQRSCSTAAHPILKQCVQSILDSNIDVLLLTDISSNSSAAHSRRGTYANEIPNTTAVTGGGAILKALRHACPCDPVCDLALAVIATNVNRAHIQVVVEALKLAFAKGGTELRTIQLFKEYCIDTVLDSSVRDGTGYTVNEAIQLAYMIALNGVRSDDLFIAMERRLMRELQSNSTYYSACATLISQCKSLDTLELPKPHVVPLSSTGLAALCQIYSNARRYNWGFLQRVLVHAVPSILLRATNSNSPYYSSNVTASHIATFIGTTRYAIALSSTMSPSTSSNISSMTISGEGQISEQQQQQDQQSPLHTTDNAAQVFEALLLYAIGTPRILHTLKYDDIRDILEILKDRKDRDMVPNINNTSNDYLRKTSNNNTTNFSLPTLHGSNVTVVAQVLLNEVVRRSGIVIVNSNDSDSNEVPLWKLCDEKIRDFGFDKTVNNNNNHTNDKEGSKNFTQSSAVRSHSMVNNNNNNTTVISSIQTLPDPTTCASIVALLLDLRVLYRYTDESALTINHNNNTINNNNTVIPAISSPSFSEVVEAATSISSVQCNMTLLFSYMFFTRKTILSRQLFFNMLYASFEAYDTLSEAIEHHRSIETNTNSSDSLLTEDGTTKASNKGKTKANKQSCKEDHVTVEGLAHHHSVVGKSHLSHNNISYNYNSLFCLPSLKEMHPLFYAAVMDEGRDETDM